MVKRTSKNQLLLRFPSIAARVEEPTPPRFHDARVPRLLGDVLSALDDDIPMMTDAEVEAELVASGVDLQTSRESWRAFKQAVLDQPEPEPADEVVPHFTVNSLLSSVKSASDHTTLRQAREEFREKLNAGTSCVCCGRYAKRYRRSINATMAGALAVLVGSRGKSEWMRAETVGAELRKFPAYEKVSYPHGEIGKLAFPAWGLVEAKPNTESAHKKHSGMWRATARGEAFVLGNLQVPKYLWIYDNHVDAVSDETTSIHQCLRGEFSYLELMKP